MDLLSKRIRKQREKSSLHARQLNKNALALLHRQLQVLERRQQQNTRALVRSRQVILQELMDSQEPEHEGPDRRESVTTSRQRALQVSEGVTRERQSLLASSSSFLEHKSEFRNRGIVHADLSFCATNSLNSVADSLAFSYPHNDISTDKNSSTHHPCRFRALSPLNPCPYFPCSRPQSYHHLKVSDIPDPVSSRSDAEKIHIKASMATLQSASLPVISDLPSSSPLFCDTAGMVSRMSTDSAKGARQADGHISPRTSVNGRLRGLRQLVRELREKNEEKRPRDWAVNYGDPMSRRLLRKPVIPVSDETV